MSHIRLIFSIIFLVVVSIDHLKGDPSKISDDYSVENAPVIVPFAGNSWFVTNGGQNDRDFHDLRRFNHQDTLAVLRTWFHLEKPGQLEIALALPNASEGMKLEVSFLDKNKSLHTASINQGVASLGVFDIDATGYYHLDIRRQCTTDATLHAHSGSLQLSGSATEGRVSFSGEEFFYWGRRGPSVHLSYQVPEEAADILYFYNEVTVPEGNDVVGSFYMANGFGQGYFGFQVNSRNERRVLFSVWSPYQTDDPTEIPEDQRVENLKRGEGVVVNDFGNEGSGGQSFLRYNWEAEVTYSFLLKVEPAKGFDDKTDYTAWFFAPEVGEWQLIASWRRPLISTYATRVHSFLENFSTRTGPVARKAWYNNQWVMDTGGNWFELTRARFTADATARAGARLDYAGGLAHGDNGFFMKNCGFFNERTPVDTWFTRPMSNHKPEIDFSQLP